MPFMTEAVLREPDVPGTLFLQCSQKLRVLKFDLELEAIAEISDKAYVIFQLFFACFFLQVTFLPGID